MRFGNSHSDCLAMEKFGFLSCLLLMLHTHVKTIPGSVREFIHVEMRLSWYDAKTYCQNHYQDLYRVLDKNDLKNLTGSANQLSWIGLYRGDQLWKWVDESVTSYFNWYKLGDCASITTDGFWHNRSCNDQLRFVCRSYKHWFLSKEIDTWNTAKQNCYSYSYGLAIIRNAAENINVTAVLESGTMAWIGLSKDTGNTWKWLHNDPLVYSNWFTSFLCVIMDWKGLWHDSSCLEEHQFVCFRENNSIPEYSLVEEKKTWREAQMFCKLQSMNLVMLKTQNDITELLGQIRTYLVNDHYVWIGLYNDPWYWSDSGHSDIRNWHDKEPDGEDLNNKITDQSCTALKDGEWYDEDCVSRLPFFCTATVRSVILVSEPKSWEEALTHCRDRYVDLASLTSDAEQQAAVRKVQVVQNGYVWTGLRFLAGSWFWVYGDSLEYENWLDRGWQQCPVTNRCGALAVASGKWEARPCEEKLKFMCFQE